MKKQVLGLCVLVGHITSPNFSLVQSMSLNTHRLEGSSIQDHTFVMTEQGYIHEPTYELTTVVRSNQD